MYYVHLRKGVFRLFSKLFYRQWIINRYSYVARLYISMYHANYFLHKIVKVKASFHSDDIQFLFEKFSDILDLLPYICTFLSKKYPNMILLLSIYLSIQSSVNGENPRKVQFSKDTKEDGKLKDYYFRKILSIHSSILNSWKKYFTFSAARKTFFKRF